MCVKLVSSAVKVRLLARRVALHVAPLDEPFNRALAVAALHGEELDLVGDFVNERAVRKLVQRLHRANDGCFEVLLLLLVAVGRKRRRRRRWCV